MLNLIDELTNWYIRFNRRRLKGEGGLEDVNSALNTLFETLLTLARTLVNLSHRTSIVFKLTPGISQSAFIPFLTENIYQGLRPFFPADVATMGLGKDLRSLHFLPFPSVRQEYLDPVVQRQVGRLQAVIELGRTVRERCVLPLKVSRAPESTLQSSH